MKRNIIITLCTLVFVIIIIFLSISTNDSRNDFSISNYEYITAIGVNEFEASMTSMSKSIFFVCSSDDDKCREEVKNLNTLASRYDLSIEYLNVDELVASEKKKLKNTIDLFDEDMYPKLIMINDALTYVDEYSTKSELISILKENNFI